MGSVFSCFKFKMELSFYKKRFSYYNLFADNIIRTSWKILSLNFKCGFFTHYVKDYKIRKLKHKILINFDSTIFYNQRRYVCKNCNATFVENAPFTGNRKVMTLLLSLIFLMILNHIPLPILQQPKNMMLQFLQLLIYSISMSKYL